MPDPRKSKDKKKEKERKKGNAQQRKTKKKMPMPRKSKKRRGGGGQQGKATLEKEKKKCTHTNGHFCQSRKSSFRLSFLFILKRKSFGRPGEKTLGFHHLFSFLSIQPNTFQKSFPFYFLSKVFYPPCFTSEQTHPYISQWRY